MKGPLAVGLLVLALASGAHAVELVPEAPDAVVQFQSACLDGSLTSEARATAIAADGGWVEDSQPDLDVKSFGVSPAISRNYDFSKPLSMRQWSRNLDGRTVKLVLATFAEKQRYSTLCAITVPEVGNAMAYSDEVKAAFKAIGVGGKSVDLPHYYEFAGKVGPDKQPVRGEVFSRTQATGGKKDMHIYAAF